MPTSSSPTARAEAPRAGAVTLPAVAGITAHAAAASPQPLAPARWDWSGVRRVLVVRLRSVGDTVLATPSLRALRRFLPGARLDLLLEDWVAPLLEGFEEIDRVITLARKGGTPARLRLARALRAERYDLVYDLHGGSTAALLSRATGARRRVGYRDYRYSFLQTDAAPPSSELWGREKTHSAEQQLALLGWTGVPVSDRPRARLAVTPAAAGRVGQRLRAAGLGQAPFALMHPAAAFDTKTWAAANFARVAEHLAARGLQTIAVAAPHESKVADAVAAQSRARVATFTDLTLPEVNALAARARLFVGNDSGIAHIASAMSVPAVVVFGSSNVAHWRPWTDAPAEVVREEMECAPCPGYTCAEFDAPECIRRVPAARVNAAVDRVLGKEVMSDE